MTGPDDASWLSPHQALLRSTSPAAAPDAAAAAEIQDLLVRYAVCYDAGDVDGVLDTFTADATYETFLGTFEETDQIRQNFAGLIARYRSSAHLIANQLIRLEGPNQARACAYVHAAVQTKDGLAYAFIGSYDDDLRRTTSGWRIARRAVRDGTAYTIAAIEPESRLSHDD